MQRAALRLDSKSDYQCYQLLVLSIQPGDDMIIVKYNNSLVTVVIITYICDIRCIVNSNMITEMIIMI